MKPIAYVSHPFGGDPENLRRARRWLRYLWEAYPTHGWVADWILCCEILEGAGWRDRGLAFDVAMVSRCDQIWLVGGRLSPGMRVELTAALANGLEVVDLLHLGPEPPEASG